MKISTHIDLSAFLAVVQHCRGEVLFCTAEGDKLNLKSTLSTYLFAAMAGNTALLESSSVVPVIRKSAFAYKFWLSSSFEAIFCAQTPIICFSEFSCRFIL